MTRILLPLLVTLLPPVEAWATDDWVPSAEETRNAAAQTWSRLHSKPDVAWLTAALCADREPDIMVVQGQLLALGDQGAENFLASPPKNCPLWSGRSAFAVAMLLMTSSDSDVPRRISRFIPVHLRTRLPKPIAYERLTEILRWCRGDTTVIASVVERLGPAWRTRSELPKVLKLFADRELAGSPGNLLNEAAGAAQREAEEFERSGDDSLLEPALNLLRRAYFPDPALLKALLPVALKRNKGQQVALDLVMRLPENAELLAERANTWAADCDAASLGVLVHDRALAQQIAPAVRQAAEHCAASPELRAAVSQTPGLERLCATYAADATLSIDERQPLAERCGSQTLRNQLHLKQVLLRHAGTHEFPVELEPERAGFYAIINVCRAEAGLPPADPDKVRYSSLMAAECLGRFTCGPSAAELKLAKEICGDWAFR